MILNTCMKNCFQVSITMDSNNNNRTDNIKTDNSLDHVHKSRLTESVEL